MMNNTLKTFVFLAALTGIFIIVGDLLGGKIGATIALVMALFMNFFAYWFSDKLALAMSGAHPVSEHEDPELHAMVEDLARKAEIPKPKVYLIPTETPNAFATGRNPQNAAVAVTVGIRQLLTRDELEGVLAHELAHIKNRDILISSIAAVIAGAISYLAYMGQWTMLFGAFGQDDDEEENSGNILSLVVTLIAIILAPIAASLIQLAISRSREYLADATGAKICRCPLSLARALEKLEAWNRELPLKVNPAQAQMFIVNPLSGETLMKLFSTHPPIKDRVARLVEMAERESF